VEKVETAIEARFQEHFVEAMAIPHASDPYRRLARVAALPQGGPLTAPGERPRRRRRAGRSDHGSAT
jgi:uncharacterized 2Fe-2S/4Fe-4S cluster protein (DUF4445 family)